jgi:hypothetical protein
MSFAQQPGRWDVVQLRVHALEPGLDHGPGVALCQQGRDMVGVPQPNYDLCGGFPFTVGPLADGAGLLDRADVRDKLRAQDVSEVTDQLGFGQPNGILMGFQPSTGSCTCTCTCTCTCCHNVTDTTLFQELEHNENHTRKHKTQNADNRPAAGPACREASPD